ncbi:MAG: hypothetical protein ACYC2P_13665 [Paludibacteraceae bacterium]
MKFYKIIQGNLVFLRAIVFIFSTLILSSYAESAQICSFEKNEPVVKAGMNCRIEYIDHVTETSIPEGKRCLKVTMGGINDKKGGSVIISIPKDKIPADAIIISFWLKGNDKNNFGPVIMFGDWCWMGKRYEKKAQIECTDPEWTKYEFKISDFVSALNRKPAADRNINLYNEFYISLGEAADYPESIEFYIDSIEIE